MDEEISIINTNSRNERIKNFFINNKKKIAILISAFLIILISFFIYSSVKKKNKLALADKYNLVTSELEQINRADAQNQLLDIINEEDGTYSVLALYYLIDNKIIVDREKINALFDKVINEIKLEKEIKNLIIYKKALFNSDTENENILLEILNPVINSDSIWKSHALYLLGEYFYYRNENKKAKEFFLQIVNLESSNQKIKLQTQQRLQSDFTE
jgi:predicted negative regulator of RcsB-dependent stress response